MGFFKTFLKVIDTISDESRSSKTPRKYSKKSRSVTYKDKNGYLRYSDSGKLVHRHMAEKKLSRKLKSGEVVHHINRKKDDNRSSNLWVF